MTAITKRLSASEDPDLAIVSISPQAQTALTYVRGALFNPVSLSVMAFAVCVGVGYAGMLGALIAMMAFVALGTGATRYRYVRKQLDRQFEYRVKQKREADRMKLLKPTGPVGLSSFMRSASRFCFRRYSNCRSSCLRTYRYRVAPVPSATNASIAITAPSMPA